MIYTASSVKLPVNRCAFHEDYFISHFCRYQECLLPLCKLCLPIHRRQHGNKTAPIDLRSIDEENLSVQNQIQGEIAHLQRLYFEIIGKVNQSNNYHSQLQKTILMQRDQVIHSINLYYDSLHKEIDHNYQRRQMWMQQITNHYCNVREEMISILQKLQVEQHLRTIIMWNRLRPNEIVGQIGKQVKKEFEPPSFIPCDIQQLISAMSKNHKMTILDLYGEMGFAKLQKILYTLRFGEQQSLMSNKQAGISLISRESKLQHKLLTSKSSERF